MKTLPAVLFLLVCFLIALPAFAQDPGAALRAKATCGPGKVQFDAKADASQHPLAQPEAGKAAVYVIGSFLGESLAEPTVKVGMDGAWLGATRGNSYIFTSVEPGEHHICVNWQSRIVTPSDLFALANFSAEAGKTYYFRARAFRARIFSETGLQLNSLDLDAANSDEGQYLVASSAFSESHPKK